MRSLTCKLMLAFLAISLTGAALASVFARWITVQEFDRLVLEQAQSSFLSEVTAYYQTHGSWTGVTEYFRQRAESRQPSPQEPGQPQSQSPQTAGGTQPPPREPDKPQSQPPQTAGSAQPPQVPVILIDQNGMVLHPVPPYRLGDYVPPEKLAIRWSGPSWPPARRRRSMRGSSNTSNAQIWPCLCPRSARW